MFIFIPSFGQETLETHFRHPNHSCPYCNVYGRTIIRGERTIKKIGNITCGGWQTIWTEGCLECGQRRLLKKKQAKQMAVEAGYKREYMRQTRILELRNFGWLFLAIACIYGLIFMTRASEVAVHTKSAGEAQITAEGVNRIEIEQVIFIDAYATESSGSDSITAYYFVGLFQDADNVNYLASFEIDRDSALFKQARNYLQDGQRKAGDFSAPMYGSLEHVPSDVHGYYAGFTGSLNFNEARYLTVLDKNIDYLSDSEATKRNAQEMDVVYGGAFLAAGAGLLIAYLCLYGKRRGKKLA